MTPWNYGSPCKIIVEADTQICLTNVIQLGTVTINMDNLTVSSDEEIVCLKKKECELLFMLAGYPGRIFTRSQLIEKIWGIDYEGDDRTVDVHIKRLRERLNPSFIINYNCTWDGISFGG